MRADRKAEKVLTPQGDDFDIIVRAAWLYYEDGLTQAQVAKRLFVSRQSVGRLLESARQHGIVRIEMDAKYLTALGLATRLRDHLRLDDAVVVPTSDGPLSRERTNERVAAATAAYVRRHLHPGVVVGLGWSDSVARALTMLSAESLDGVTLASAAGTIDNVAHLVSENPEAVRRLRTVPAPLFVSSAETAQALLAEDAVESVFALARGASITLTGVGAVRPGSSAVRTGMVTEEEVADFGRRGAVGDMLGQWFDLRGRVVAGDVSERTVSLRLADVRALPNVVGVAAGREKVDAIRGAVAGRYLNVLVTDEPTAELLLAR
ncbi:sugar-binding transcriptional regulator [Tessaracoccus sp. OS52]|uniref:sugar-binding transcriptional regulator n=1 Tax=Tessaracoccus sp. OS52 TaxID=2886691 RepID=UPI001D10BAE4|nr:sugar-binding transcriptional regulator [Tessaracoccus sp. OS52]MCC2594579.1 sugar-binding transcriptional regulator [Tessaracoccus sp. OS52]